MDTNTAYTQSPPAYPAPMNPHDERTWAAFAHASAALNLISGFGGVIGALVIWLMQKEKSPMVAFHALQALAFQGAQTLIIMVFVGGTWIVGFALSFLTLGFGAIIAVPLMFITFALGMLLWFGGLVYSLYGAYQVYEGRPFRYLWLGDWLAQRVSAPLP